MALPKLHRIAIPLLLLLGGCLEFSAQVVELHYDGEQDRLTLNLVYHGLFFEGDSGEDALRRAVSHGEFCLIAWPMHFQPQEMADEPHPIAQHLVQHVRAEPVGFFLDAQGRLSAGQRVVFEKVSELFRLINAEIKAAMLMLDESAPDEPLDKETVLLLKEAARQDHAWLRLDGNAIEFSAFVSDRSLEAMKLQAAEAILDAEKDELTLALDYIARCPLSFVRRGKEARLVFGNSEGRARFVFSRCTEHDYKPNLVEQVRAEYGFELDARIAPLLAAPPLRLAPERLEQLLDQLASDQAPLRAAAARELVAAEANRAEIEAFAEQAPLEARRALKEILEELGRLAGERSFAETLDQTERVRILLGLEPASAEAALRRELELLPVTVEEAPEDLHAFWQDWLQRRLDEASGKDAEEQTDPETAESTGQEAEAGPGLEAPAEPAPPPEPADPEK